MRAPELKLHEKRCDNCRYYRINNKASKHSVCLLLGRILSFIFGNYSDMWRYCAGWKRRPKIWDIKTEKNPFWHDKYIPRKMQINLRKRYGIKE